MGEGKLIVGDGWLSDDSSFYGDDDERARLVSLCEEANADHFWSTHEKDMNVTVAKIRANTKDVQVSLFNPGEGKPDSWQLGESADAFEKRLPPLTTSQSTCDWIWAHNPYPRRRSKSAPSNMSDFVTRGIASLAQSLRTRNEIQATSAGKAKSTTSKALHQESKLLQQRITDLAVETNVLAGKWMLFPELDDLSRTWRLIIDAVTNNRLGSTAKVAPDDGRTGARLICVYTEDFRDKDDVLRVLQELVSMGLAGAGRAIYYKSDPYTLLNIYRETAAEYGLQASLYTSQKMLAETSLVKATVAAAQPQQKQSSLNGYFGLRNATDVD